MSGKEITMAAPRQEETAHTKAPSSGKAERARATRRNPEVGRALANLTQEGKVAGLRSVKISARVDPGILAAAAARFGLKETDISEVVNASLTLAASPDPFKAWLKNPGQRLPDDFELAI
jgi:hypothetical protein